MTSDDVRRRPKTTDHGHLRVRVVLCFGEAPVATSVSIGEAASLCETARDGRAQG
jgi:hypothetical protein